MRSDGRQTISPTLTWTADCKTDELALLYIENTERLPPDRLLYLQQNYWGLLRALLLCNAAKCWWWFLVLSPMGPAPAPCVSWISSKQHHQLPKSTLFSVAVVVTTYLPPSHFPSIGSDPLWDGIARIFTRLSYRVVAITCNIRQSVVPHCHFDTYFCTAVFRTALSVSSTDSQNF